MSRRKTRKRRHREPEPTPAPVVPERPVNWSRLRQVFGNLSHRGTRIFKDYVLSPVVVDALDPTEAAILSELALSEEAKKGPAN
jgi:hypothetical protein